MIFICTLVLLWAIDSYADDILDKMRENHKEVMKAIGDTE